MSIIWNVAYHIATKVNNGRIAKLILMVACKNLINFGHKDINYKIKFG